MARRMPGRVSGRAARMVAKQFLGGDMAYSTTVAPLGFDEAIFGLDEYEADLKREFETIFTEEVSDAVDTIKAAWPTFPQGQATGFSKAGWSWRMSRSSNGFVWFISNPVSYTGYVHPAGTKTTLLDSLVRPTVQTAAQTGVDRFLAVLAKMRKRKAAATPAAGSGTSTFLSAIKSYLGY